MPSSTTQPTINLNPPNVQRVVVEHVVHSSESLPHITISVRLRAFSGKTPRPLMKHIMRRGGVFPSEFDQQLLKQFCRGCWENALIVGLQLEQRKKSPPSFAELLLLLRTDEDRQAVKINRMKQHLSNTKSTYNASKQRVMSHLQKVQIAAETNHGTEFDTLRKQVADLSAQLSSIKAVSH